eukprot:TRINITY_DN4928_c0_g1_i1.p1 TRINITY_DN4928_c0_g1~~TRINITY_DN4928_c0_g1_i1.p1  ORF type:complete len:381 (-),score=38.57 TRINITY_DN4928_c0_g1_i1:18-1160(-)
MLKRRHQPKADDTEIFASKRRKFREADGVEAEPVIREVIGIHRVPMDVLGVILWYCEWQDKIQFMQTCKVFLGVTPSFITVLNCAPYASKITSQQVLEGTLSRCTHLRELTLDNCQLGTRSRQFGQALLSLTQLRVLSVVGTGLPHSILSQISKLENLQQLRLAGTYVTDKILLGLQELPQLNFLDIGQTPLKPKGNWPKILGNFTNLGSLRLDAVPMTGVSSDFLECLTGIHKLDLSYTDCKVMPALATLTELRSLILVHAKPLNPQDFIGFSLPPLHQLILDLASLPAIHALPSLKHLKLIDLGGEFMDEFFTVLTKFTNLQSLELSRLREPGSHIGVALRDISRTLKLTVCSLVLYSITFWYSCLVLFGWNFSSFGF